MSPPLGEPSAIAPAESRGLQGMIVGPEVCLCWMRTANLSIRQAGVKSARCYTEKLRIDQLIEHQLAHPRLDAAQALHLLGSQPQTRHFQELRVEAIPLRPPRSVRGSALACSRTMASASPSISAIRVDGARRDDRRACPDRSAPFRPASRAEHPWPPSASEPSASRVTGSTPRYSDGAVRRFRRTSASHATLVSSIVEKST